MMRSAVFASKEVERNTRYRLISLADSPAATEARCGLDELAHRKHRTMRRYSANFPMIPVPLRFQSTRTTPTQRPNPLWVRSFSARGDKIFPVVSLIRSVSGAWIRIYAVIFTGKVMAKQENSDVISTGYTCYENP
jgi:hypothetical protein